MASRTVRWYRTVLASAVVLPTVLFAAAGWNDYDRLSKAARATLERTSVVMREHVLKVSETNELIIKQIRRLAVGRSWDEIAADKDLNGFLTNEIAGKPRPSGRGGTAA